MDVECPKGGRHKWASHYDDDPHCKKCGELMGREEVISLLNAAMQLTADEAQEAINYIEDNDETIALAAYAAAWREACGT